LNRERLQRGVRACWFRFAPCPIPLYNSRFFLTERRRRGFFFIICASVKWLAGQAVWCDGLGAWRGVQSGPVFLRPCCGCWARVFRSVAWGNHPFTKNCFDIVARETGNAEFRRFKKKKINREFVWDFPKTSPRFNNTARRQLSKQSGRTGFSPFSAPASQEFFCARLTRAKGEQPVGAEERLLRTDLGRNRPNRMQRPE